MGSLILNEIMQVLLKLVLATFIVTLTQAKIIAKTEAKQVLQLRQKRFVSYRRSNPTRECFQKKVCEYEEYAEGAENTYGEEVIRNTFATKFQTAFKNFYTDCHSQNPTCKDKGKNCECNKSFKAFAADYQNAAASKTTATEAPDCGWFCTTTGDGDY